MGGAGGGGPLPYSWTATDPVAAGGFGNSVCKQYAYKLPDWMTFLSPSANRSSQVSDEELCIGFNANDPRARNVGPANNPKWGLSIETARTNLVLQSNSWSGGGVWIGLGGTDEMAQSTGKTDPAKGSAATQFDNASTAMNSGQQSPYQAISNARALSTWVMGMGAPIAGCNKFGGGTESCFARFRHWTDGAAAYANITETKWRRISFTYPMDESDSIVLDTKNQPAGAGVILGTSSFLAFGAQAEAANYPSSYIPNTTTKTKRSLETLLIPAAKAGDVLKNGFFELTIRFAPNFAHTELSTDYHFFQIHDGEKWRVYMDSATKAIHVKFNNTELVASNALQFARESEIEVKVQNLESDTVKLSVSGAGLVGGGIFNSQTAVVPAPTGFDIFILSHHDGAEECSDLRYFEIK